MHTLDQGCVGLARAIYEYQIRGYAVSVPLVDARDYDLIIEKDNKFKSVQCKTTNTKSKTGNGYAVDLRSIKTNTKETIIKKRGKYDLLFVMCGNNDCYSIPAKLLPMSGTTVGGPKWNKFKLNDVRLDERVVCKTK